MNSPRWLVNCAFAERCDGSPGTVAHDSLLALAVLITV